MPHNPCEGCVHFTPIQRWVGFRDGRYAGAEAAGCLGNCHRPEIGMDPDSSYVHDGDREAPCRWEWYELDHGYEFQSAARSMTPMEIWNG